MAKPQEFAEVGPAGDQQGVGGIADQTLEIAATHAIFRFEVANLGSIALRRLRRRRWLGVKDFNELPAMWMAAVPV
jgi:hypothetical protein